MDFNIPLPQRGAGRRDRGDAWTRALDVALERTSLGVKLAALGAVITAAVIAVAFWALSVEIRDEHAAVIRRRAARNQRDAAAARRRTTRQQLLFAASLITQTPSLQYDLSIYRAEANARRTCAHRSREHDGARAAASGYATSSSDLLVVTDDSGRVFASATRGGATYRARHQPARHSRRCSAPSTPARRADTGDSPCFAPTRDTSRSPRIRSCKAGITLGSLVLGRRLDSAFVAAARAASDAASRRHGGQVRRRGERAGAERLRPRSPRSRRGRDVTKEPSTVRIGDEDFVAAPLSFGETQNREPVRLWMLQPLSRRVAELTRPLRRQFMFYGSLAVLVATIGAALVARHRARSVPAIRRVTCDRARRRKQRQGRFDAEHEAAEVRTLERIVQPADGFAGGEAARSSSSARRSSRRRTSC